MEIESSSSSSKGKWIHNVFLSFRGEDTRTTFISHLFTAFKTAGINVFKDDPKLERGRSIAPELLNAIRQSKFFVVVLSRNYADSSWCLNELTEIMSCWRNDMGCNVYPVFYDVDPSDVRNQKGEFGEAFSKLEQTNSMEDINNWRAALTCVADLAGFTLRNREEADVVEKIVKKISKELRDSYSSTFEIGHGLVGIDEKLNEFKEKLRLDSPEDDGARFIGICGMGGIGKSTLARLACDSFSTHFDGKSYLSNVRGKNITSLQMQILSEILNEEFVIRDEQDGANIISKRLCNRKVLVVIDDVDNIDQLRYLAGDQKWFGLGSRIIITSRDAHLLEICGIKTDDIYKPRKLNNDEALDLSRCSELNDLLKLKHLQCLNYYRPAIRKLPSVTGFANLTCLMLEDCPMLLEIPEFVGTMQTLALLKLKGCRNLKRLPNKMNGMKSLKYLDLFGCSELDELPEDLGEVKCLKYLDASKTAIRKLPSVTGLTNLTSLLLEDCPMLLEIPESVGTLQTLVRLNLKGCRSLKQLPNRMNGMKSLEFLDLSGCSELDDLPEDLEEVKCLKYLDASKTAIRKLPMLWGIPESVGTLKSSSSFSSKGKWIHDVFLSFRGEDTRTTFISHLFTAFKTAGINVFKDDPKLKRGRSIAPELLNAIRQSKFFVVVLSRNYADSSWCLNELTEIMLCWRNDMGCNVYPVFYDVDPSDVRNQKGEFGEAFSKLEQTNSMEDIKNWRADLSCVANLAGFTLLNREEAAVVRKIVEKISKELRDSYSSTFEIGHGLVGIDEKLNEFKEKLRLDSPEDDGARFIGICGMGGIGKSTLARLAFDSLSTHFDGKSYLSNVRVAKTKHLQMQILSEILNEEIVIRNEQDVANIIRKRFCNRKVLVVIDDVDNIDQLRYLAGDQKWFGLGSRIIITSRDAHLLEICGIKTDDIYKPRELNNDEALKLVSWKAFKSDHPPSAFSDICESLVKYCGGLPLALEVLGSFLRGRTINEWKTAIDQLKIEPEDKIFNVLRVSFNGLKDTEKNIFLDIACFFKGQNCNYVTELLESCDFYPSIGIRVLVEKSLLTIEDDKLWMHDLLQDMGQKIVIQESPYKPGKRTRLWNEGDIRHVLTENTGTEVVEGIMLPWIWAAGQDVYADANAFSNMKRLRLLKIHYNVFPYGLAYFPGNLRLLDWEGCSLQLFPAGFQPDKLVHLRMPYSSLVELWEEPVSLLTLKSIDLSHSIKLKKTPNLENALNLQSLNFKGCSQLSSVHSSIGYLRSLTTLNLRECIRLKRLPNKINGMKSLEYLDLSGCSELDELPEDLREVKCLKYLDASKTAIRKLPYVTGLTNLMSVLLEDCPMLLEIPESVGTLKTLARLNLKGCRSLKWLPNRMNGMKSLEYLDLSGCSELDELPEDLGEVKCLKYLDASKTAIRKLPSVTGLTNLISLLLEDCPMLLEIPESVGTLKTLARLNLKGCRSLKRLPNMNGMESLEYVILPESIFKLITWSFVKGEFD